ncbi:hypothetical protein D3P07_08085 [Paenibacillus sp. 1011MAR3C5]|uniref:TlpA family protein disulfide reductase n=1 Tax=Paenibacillus sp. 1011MAR3C5 TaxID=1675787 RepID=UPI000E6CEFB6|nr:hypothetical protein [Paenibacillus sp. 1011MAR3C5]RJE90163.1 hypothetical protein D3P07_08085 [Paenibacillus sp. 1011MAR3C5]
MDQMEKQLPSFLKVEEGLQIGDFMPNIRIPNYDSLQLYDFITDYLLIATISTTCAPCLPAMEAIDALIQRYPAMNLVIFIDTEKGTFEQAKEIFHPSARLYHATDDVMFGELKTRGYPWAYGLNAEGQIITIEHAGSMEYWEKLMFPFKRFMKPQAVLFMKEEL